MKILVTGGAGFIGSAFLRLASQVEPAWELHCLDAETYAADRTRLGEVKDRVTYTKGDIRDVELVRSLVRESDLVVNFAAETHNDNSLKSPVSFVSTNVGGTSVLLSACAEFRTSFHQISTDEVYGDLPLGNGEKFIISSPYRPSSPYSASKASADLLVGAWARSFNVETSISICCNNFGPGQHSEKLIPSAIQSAKRGERPRLYGDGQNVREWIHVDDHATALVKLFKLPKRPEIIHIGSGVSRSNQQVVEAILRANDLPEKFFELVEDRPGHDLRYELDSTQTEQILGWRPVRTDFESEILNLSQHND